MTHTVQTWLFIVLLMLVSACGPGMTSDAGVDGGGAADAGAVGADAGADGGTATDAGTDGGFDAGGTDAGFDAGSSDAGFDAGGTDAGFDAGSTDAGSTDAGFDAGGTDAGFDAGFDAGTNGPVQLVGAAAKGPLIQGSPVTISTIDAQANPTGLSFPTQTTNLRGDYALTFMYRGPALITATGYYYNEITGGLSLGSQTLTAYASFDVGGPQVAYVNLVTHLISGRVRTLMSAGMGLRQATAQAEAELRTALSSVTTVDAGSTELSVLGTDTASNGWLLAVSGLFAKMAHDQADGGPSDAILQSTINGASLAFAASGQLPTTTVTAFHAAERRLEPDDLMSRMTTYFSAGGSAVQVPDVNRGLDTDGDGVANREDTCTLLANPTQQPVFGVCNYRREELASFNDGQTLGQVAAVDLNRDGLLDVVATGTQTSFEVFLASDGGALRSASIVEMRDAGVTRIADGLRVLDVDGDGVPDVTFSAESSSNARPYWARGNGAGQFSFPRQLDPLLGNCATNYLPPWLFLFADVAGDAAPELIACNQGCTSCDCPCHVQNLQVHRGRGDGTFSPRFPDGGYATSLPDGGFGVPLPDGGTGPISADAGAPPQWALLNPGGPDGGSAGYSTSSSGLAAIVSGQVDTDGIPDLVVFDLDANGSRGGRLFVLLGNGMGRFTGQEPVRVDIPLFPTLLVADFDGDGSSDIFIGDFVRQTFLYGDGTGRAWTEVSHSLLPPTPFSSTAQFKFADVTGDGKLDLLAAAPEPLSDGLRVYPAVGRGFGPHTTIARTTACRNFSVGDFNRDGRPDAVLAVTPAFTGWPTPLPLLIESFNVQGYGSW